MANWHTLQNNFLSGEVSPRFVAAVDTALADQAVSAAQNGLVLLQGNLTKRMGTRFIEDTQVGPEQTARVWPFFDIRNRHALTLWKANQVEIVNKDLTSVRAATPDKAQIVGYEQFLNNPYFVLGLTGWSNTGGYTKGDTSYLVNSVPGDLIQMHVKFEDTRAASIDEVFIRQSISVVNPITSLIISLKALKTFVNPAIGVDARVKVRIGTTRGGSEIAERTYDILETFSTNSESVITSPVSGQLWVDAIMILDGLSSDTINAREDYRIFLSELLIYGSDGSVITPDIVNTPYADRHLEGLHFLQSPYDDQELIILHPEFAPQKLYFDGSEYVLEDYDFIAPPDVWGPNNQPSIGTGYQGRLVLSGAPNDPETIWSSRSGSWKDFTQSDPTPEPDDPVDITPTERGVNTWINGFKRLVFGNTRHELSVDSESGVLQPGDLGIHQQDSYGSLRSPQKITVGISVVLTTGGNTALRMVKFNRDDGGFIAPDHMLKAEHLGRKVIRRIFHTGDPHEILWCIMADGSISVMTFDEDLKIYAWTHFVTDGRFIDGCVITDEFGRDNVVLIVERVIESVTTKYVEVITDLRNIQNWQYMDSAIRIFMDTDQTTVGGLQHLEAKEVHVFMDDAYMGTRVVVDGTIEIEGPAGFVDVGLTYDFRIITLPQGSLVSYMGLTAKKRYSKIGVRGIFSRPPMINGQRPPDRSPQAIMNIPEPAELIMDETVISMDINETAQVVISEPLPLRLTIAGIFGKLSSNEV